LVREDGVTDVVDLGVDILHLATLELVHVNNFERCGFGIGGADILAGLVEMAFGRHFWMFLMVSSGQPMKLPA
jgi:hypothetical protein